jgi:hypothetical protein
MSDRPRIEVSNLCKKHQWLLVQQAGYREQDPWRSLVIMAQIALFQATTTDPEFWKHVGDDVTRLPEIGCLACFKPDKFGEIVEAAKLERTNPGSIKRLGESWVEKKR